MKKVSPSIDEAIRSYKQQDISGYEKVDEVPYDFIRKRLSIMIKKDGRYFMVTKGALSNVLAVCPFAQNKAGDKIATNTVEQIIQQKFEEHSNQGFRVLGVAMRDMGTQSVINKDSEKDMTLLGSCFSSIRLKKEFWKRSIALNNLVFPESYHRR